jgi:hypothetical protein
LKSVIGVRLCRLRIAAADTKRLRGDFDVCQVWRALLPKEETPM